LPGILDWGERDTHRKQQKYQAVVCASDIAPQVGFWKCLDVLWDADPLRASSQEIGFKEDVGAHSRQSTKIIY
jgi:hypothetical protein